MRLRRSRSTLTLALLVFVAELCSVRPFVPTATTRRPGITEEQRLHNDSSSKVAHSTILYSRPSDEIVVTGSSVATIVSSMLVMWSEYSVVRTGCGPFALADWLEESSYYLVLVFASLWIWNTILGKVMPGFSILLFEEKYMENLVLRAALWSSSAAVVGAFLALGFQYIRGANMDAYTGIDVEYCKALRDLM